MKNPVIEPYLFFGGRCDEALAFYQNALGAKVEMLMRFNEAPTPPPPGAIPAGFEKKVMHASLKIGDSRVMASDGDGDKPNFAGFTLSLSLADEATARKAFAALSDGGTVRMPIGKTFWSSCFGMVQDKFGVGWMVTIHP
ncbi:MAG TPA: VOC family protein [Candidatus Didemnitutus sp.]|nr:VOC family protein [Candidatus Didemnitutus sp.]